MNRPRVAIVGAGIGGLTVAWELSRRLKDAVDIRLFEQSDRVGGNIRTIRRDGWLIEGGPDSFIRTKPAAVGLCERLGIADELIAPLPDHQRALVVRDGSLHPVPHDFHLLVPRRLESLLDTPLLSTAAKLRLLGESTLPSGGQPSDTLAEFTRRRWGQEMLERLVQPLVAGIYSADPEELSLQATMPQFLKLERIHGSLTAAGRTQRSDARSGGARYGLFASFADGMQRLPDELRSRIEGHAAVHLGTETTRVIEEGDHYRVETASNLVQADHVVLALPAGRAAKLLERPDVRSRLERITAASSAVVVTGHRLDDFQHPLDAFGVVVPHVEGSPATAISIASRKFPGRAPAGHVLVRTFLGSPSFSVVPASDDELIEQSQRVLRKYLGLHKSPVVTEVVRYHGGSPQYRRGHLDAVDDIEAAVAAMPGLHLVGASYRGVGIPDTIQTAVDVADRIAAAINPISNSA